MEPKINPICSSYPQTNNFLQLKMSRREQAVLITATNRQLYSVLVWRVVRSFFCHPSPKSLTRTSRWFQPPFEKIFISQNMDHVQCPQTFRVKILSKISDQSPLLDKCHQWLAIAPENQRQSKLLNRRCISRSWAIWSTTCFTKTRWSSVALHSSRVMYWFI